MRLGKVRIADVGDVAAYSLALQAACDYVNGIFRQFDPNTTMQLDFEKVLCPALLISKKRYSGALWTKESGPDYIADRGLETVRRDICPMVRNAGDASSPPLTPTAGVADALGCLFLDSLARSVTTWRRRCAPSSSLTPSLRR